MTDDEGRKALEAACIAICRTRKLIGPQGTCAAICMGQLGDAPARGCDHAVKVHGNMAKTALKAYLAALPGWRLVPMRPTEEMAEAGLDSPSSTYCDRCSHNGYTGNQHPVDVYADMLFEAPPPPGLEDSE